MNLKPFALAATLACTAVLVQAAPPVGKTVLQQTPFPPDGWQTSVIRTVIPAHAQAPLHQHAGIEIGYVVQGGGTLHVAGRPDQPLHPGEAALVPPRTPHWFTNGDATTEIVSTYVTEAGKPVMEVLKPAP